jgi:YHS domain-containing protein
MPENRLIVFRPLAEILLEFGRARRYFILGEIEMKRRYIAILMVIAVVLISSSMISQSKSPSEKPQKAVDPVCGLTVDKLPELSMTYKGETYYFCSAADLKKFKDNPGKYAKK